MAWCSESNPFSLTNAEVYDPNGSVNVPGIIANDASVLEGNSGTNSLIFNLSLTMTSALPVTVQYATTDGTASAFAWGVGTPDYVAVTGTVTFPPGSTNQVVQVSVLGDTILEPDETLYLNLSVPTQAWIARATATGTILNDDTTPTLSIAPVSVVEGDSGLSNAVFNVSLSAQSLTMVTVDYFTGDQTAQAGYDYVPTAGTLMFNPGVTNLAISVPAIGDLVPEPDETFVVNLANAQNASIVVSNATGTILNDDGIPGRLHHFDWSAISDPQTQSIGFPVTITARDYYGAVVTNLPWPVRLSAQTTNVIATNLDFEMPGLAPWTPFDYTGQNHPAQQGLYNVAGLGQPSTAFCTIAGGGISGITQNIWLAGGIPYTFSVNLAALSIAYDESCYGANVYLQAGPTNVVWGTPSFCGSGSATATLKLVYTPPTNGVYPLQIIVERGYYYGDSLVIYADDVQISYPVIAPTLLTNSFTHGVWTGLVSVLQPAANLTLVADDHGGHHGFSNPFNVQPLADLALTASSQIQGTPPLRTGMNLQFNLVLTNRGPSDVADAVVHCVLPPNLSFFSATNQQGSISNSAGVVDWMLGPLPVGTNFTAVIVCRADVPGDFTNQFGILTSVLDLNLADNSVAVSNHIDPPLLVIGDASATEAYGSVTGLVFAVTLSGPSAQTISVDYFTADGSASNGVDYVGTNGTVVFAPGATNATLRVYSIDDILDEPDRSFNVLLTNAVNAIVSDAVGIGTVMDDDLPPVIDIADTNILEGDVGTKNVSFALTLSKPAIVDVTVRCSTATGTAGTNDFTATTTTVTFPAGTTNATFPVPIRGNTVNEPDETFFVNLSLPVNATLARTQAVCTILNDDAVPGRLDHFVWDVIPSPRYGFWPFPVVLRAVDYLGNPATNASLSATVTARSESGYLERMADNFEDGNSIGWTNYNSSFSAMVTNETAAGGTNSLRLTGSVASQWYGLRRTFSNSQPNKISFAVRVGRTTQVAGRLTAYANSLYRSAVFYFDSKGQMGLMDRGQIPFRSVPYTSNHWYQVELTFDWAAQKVDCRIDGALAITNVSFPDSSVTSMDGIVLGNQDNTTSWWDDFRVFYDNLTNVFTITPSNFTQFVSAAKTNTVTISGNGTKTFLTADDGLEHVGKSGFFDLLPVSLTLLTPASVNEGSAPVGAQVYLSAAVSQAVTVNLTSSVPAKLTVPAAVTIAANQTNASFNLTIVDDTNTDWIKPVSLSASGTNVVAATNVISIIDNDPRLALVQYGLLADHRFQLGLQGPPAQNFELFASSNLIDWNSILTFSFTNAPLMIIDPASTNLDRRFYRLAPAAP